MSTELTRAEKVADEIDKFRDYSLHRLPLKPMLRNMPGVTLHTLDE